MHRSFTHRESCRQARQVRSAGAVLVLGALSAVLLAGCADGGSAGTGTGSAGTSTEGKVSSGAGASVGAGAGSAPGTDSATAGKGLTLAPVPSAVAPADVSRSGVPVVGPKLTKSANLDLRVKQIDAAAAAVRAVATGLGAQVLSEQIGNGNPDPVPMPIPMQGKPGSPSAESLGPDSLGGFGTLTLSVPANKLDTALDQLARIGTVLRRTTTSQDVTAQYVDAESRLKTMRASVERVRALLAQAKDLGQVVTLESELSRREADLESLESQLAALKDNVESSTVTISLSTPASAAKTVRANGFLVGLHSGWNAFTSSASGLFTAVGAVLPFALFFAVVGAPLAWWWHRSRASRPAAVTTSSSP